MSSENRRTRITIAELLCPVRAPQTASSEVSPRMDARRGEPSRSASGADGSPDLPQRQEENVERFTKHGRCFRCLKEVSPKNRADHVKVHCLQGTYGVAVPQQKRCSRCMQRRRPCIVATMPCHKDINTMRCLKCISNKECCSFRDTYKGLCISTMRVHPASQ